MIVFYSDHCGHCRMLINTLDKHDTTNKIKRVCIDTLPKQLPQIHSVPALMTLPEKTILFGKQVFDFLLLPGKGLLVKPQPSQQQPQQPQQPSVGSDPNQNDGQSQGQGQTQAQIGDPIAFSILGSRGLSDNYAPIDDEVIPGGNQDRMYCWSTIDEQGQMTLDMNQEVRTKKELPDLSALQTQRALDLTQNDLNIGTLPPAIAARD